MEYLSRVIDFASVSAESLCFLGPAILFLLFTPVIMLFGIQRMLRPGTRLSGVGDILLGLLLAVNGVGLLLSNLNGRSTTAVALIQIVLGSLGIGFAIWII